MDIMNIILIIVKLYHSFKDFLSYIHCKCNINSTKALCSKIYINDTLNIFKQASFMVKDNILKCPYFVSIWIF